MKTLCPVLPRRNEPPAYSFIDTLADMHVLDPDAIGLSALGKKDYVGRQI